MASLLVHRMLKLLQIEQISRQSNAHFLYISLQWLL